MSLRLRRLIPEHEVHLCVRLGFNAGVALGWLMGPYWVVLGLLTLLPLLTFTREVRRYAETPRAPELLPGVLSELDATAPDGACAYLVTTEKWYDKARGAWHERAD